MAEKIVTPATHPGQQYPEKILVLPLRNLVMFPAMMVSLHVEDKTSVALIDEVSARDRFMGVLSMRDPEKQPPTIADDLYETGTLCRILKLMKDEEGGQTILVQGLKRFGVKQWLSTAGKLAAAIEILHDTGKQDNELKAMEVNLKRIAGKVVELDSQIPREVAALIQNIQDIGMLTDIVASGLNISAHEKQGLLETLDLKERYRKVIPHLNQQLEVMELGSKIQSEVKDSIDQNQRKYFLREQMKAIRKELGEDDSEKAEIEELEKRIKEAKMPEEVEKEAMHELTRLSAMPQAAPDYSMTKTYIEWLVEMPWAKATADRLDIRRAQKILDDDHYGLEKVKKRIVEYLAVRKLKNDLHGPILCFAGPPGTGKTSLGKSIARALGRKFVRMSLGGVRDEAEMRGHRRTYIGALPGRIIQGIKKAGTNNPVFMLDEVDKLGNDFRGDPSSALLEVLDPEQNFSFQDHYLNVPFDLSKVMFIATANMLETVPPPLRDRMEIMQFSGYTLEEKTAIARKYIVPRQLEAHGLTAKQLGFDKVALQEIALSYTKEAGLRKLEQKVAAIVRGVARKIAVRKRKKITIRKKDVVTYLGPARFISEVKERTSQCGVVTGLAWTAVGGDILFVEATRMPGGGRLILTGQLGDVMKESAQAALSYIKANSAALKIDPAAFKKNDFHVHVPAGAIPKDGPSAGVTMLTALCSLLRNQPVRNDVAMTGEITLRGAVLPIGGLKEKVLAARQAGITHIICPFRNKTDIQELQPTVKRGLTFHFVKQMKDVIRIALADKK